MARKQKKKTQRRKRPAVSTQTAPGAGARGEIPESPQFPNTALGQLESFDPTLLGNGKDMSQTDQFVLALALAFNDLKGIMLLQGWARECYRDAKAGSAQFGQLAGLLQQSNRILAGYMNEVLELLRTHKGRKTPEFSSLVKRMTPGWRREWKRLCAAADSGDTSKGKALTKVRAASNFHYHQTKALQNGYISAFIAEPTGFTDKAYLSVGNRPETTRFYFADAAVERSHAILCGDVHLDSLLGELLSISLTALAGVVTARLGQLGVWTGS